MGWLHERAYYRVAYPTKLRPILLVQGKEFDVVDLSEQGVRFRLGKTPPPEIGNEIQGTFQSRRGEAVQVRGLVVRVTDGEVAVALEAGVPLRVIMAEQRLLLDRRGFMGR